MDLLDYKILSALKKNARQKASEISLEHPRYTDNFVSHIHENPHVVSCYYLTGEFDYMLKVCCRSSRDLEEIHRRIKQLEGVRMIKTHYVLHTEKNIYSCLPELEDFRPKQKNAAPLMEGAAQ